MKAEAIKLLEFIAGGQGKQFVIPVYQRTYSWDIKQCEQLWEDILNIGQSNNIDAHFIGSIIFVMNDTYKISHNKLLVIDGQQRLTTINLLLIALRNALGEKEEFLGKFSKTKINNRYLLNADEDNEQKYKLILSENDKDSLLYFLDNDRTKPLELSLKIQDNFAFFEKMVSENRDKLEGIFRGLEKLMIVSISLERDKDNPQLIFESMNSTGKTLTQTDLIRNYILMDLEPHEQSKLYKNYWRAMEIQFQQQDIEKLFNSFMRYYLILKTGRLPNIAKVYEAFKIYQQENRIDIQELLKDLKKYCGYFCAIALNQEKDKELKNVFERLAQLQADTSYPLLLMLYNDYVEMAISKHEFIQIISLIESYVFRRAVCELPTNALNNVFRIFTTKIDKNKYFESVKAHFLLLRLSERFPNDEEFKEKFINKDFYNFSKNRYYFSRLENFERKEIVSIGEYTIEHIMPQTENLNLAWQLDLGKDYKAIQEKYLHTAGNLTLTGYNSELRDKSFKEKRDGKDGQGGFRQSPLRLNEGLRNVEIWNEQAILKRAKDLADLSAKIWLSPTLPEEVLNEYKDRKNKNQYNLSDYNFNSKTKELFEILDKEILALNENIKRNFTKIYISYKFYYKAIVDIIPLQKELKLTLNINISELHDAKRIARDISNIGSWGNGDVDFYIKNKEETPER